MIVGGPAAPQRHTGVARSPSLTLSANAVGQSIEASGPLLLRINQSDRTLCWPSDGLMTE